MTRLPGLRILIGFLLAGSVCCGCASVPAYQRGRLAHPRMAPDDAASVGQQHMQSVQEGALGGGESAVSGCGCN